MCFNYTEHHSNFLEYSETFSLAGMFPTHAIAPFFLGTAYPEPALHLKFPGPLSSWSSRIEWPVPH